LWWIVEGTGGAETGGLSLKQTKTILLKRFFLQRTLLRGCSNAINAMQRLLPAKM
jgi:hypothetical protein